MPTAVNRWNTAITESTQLYGESFSNRGLIKLPRVLECGGEQRNTAAPLCLRIDYRGSQERLKWYKYLK